MKASNILSMLFAVASTVFWSAVLWLFIFNLDIFIFRTGYSANVYAGILIIICTSILAFKRKLPGALADNSSVALCIRIIFSSIFWLTVPSLLIACAILWVTDGKAWLEPWPYPAIIIILCWLAAIFFGPILGWLPGTKRKS